MCSEDAATVAEVANFDDYWWDENPQRSDYEFENEDYYKEEDDKSWLFLVQQKVSFDDVYHLNDGCDYLLADSGAHVHVCPKDYATDYDLVENVGDLNLATATGEPIKTYGRRSVKYMMDDRVTVEIPFILADVTGPIISIMRLGEAGFTRQSYLEKDGKRIWIHVVNKGFYLKALRKESDKICPV